MNAGTLAGNFTCNGNVVLGNATSDTIALTGIVSIGTSGSYLANLGGTVLLPTYTFTGDLNTGIWSSGADAIDISTAGVQRVRVDSNGVFTIGSSASPPAASIRLGQTFAIHTSATYGGVSLNTWSTTAAEGSIIDFNRSKSATIGTMTVVASGDLVGSVNFRAADGTNFINVAGITAYVDGTPGTNDMPGRLSFLTTADGAAALTERLRIDSSGSIIINATSSIGATTSKLQINDDQATVGGISINRFINSTSGNSMAFTKSRNATVGSHTIVNSGDSIGSIPFYGSDGTNYVVAAQIQGAVDGTPGTNDMPGRLVFSTTADGASSLSERMRIDSSGKVGIGITPTSLLHVSGSVSSADVVTLQKSTASTGITTDYAQLALYNNNNTTNSYNSIWFYGNNSSSVQQGYAAIGSVFTTTTASSEAGALTFYTRTGGGAVTERMRIDSDGNVGMGGTAPSTARLYATRGTSAYPANSGTTQSSGHIARFKDNSNAILDIGGNSSNGYWLQCTDQTGLNATYPLLLNYNGGNVGIGVAPSYQLHLSTDSAGKPTTNTWTITSDSRIKKDISDANLDRCLEIIMQIPLKRFTIDESVFSTEQVKDRSILGWIAQDVQPVFKKSVGTKRLVKAAKKEDGSDDVIEDCLDLNTSQLLAALYGAVQKLAQKIEKLEKK